jgi:hypothetical protein
MTRVGRKSGNCRFGHFTDQDYDQAKKECNEVLVAQPDVGIATDVWRSKYAVAGRGRFG